MAHRPRALSQGCRVLSVESGQALAAARALWSPGGHAAWPTAVSGTLRQQGKAATPVGTGTSCLWAKAAHPSSPQAAPGSINKFCHLLSEHRLRLGHSAPGPAPQPACPSPTSGILLARGHLTHRHRARAPAH